ncbi:hypothetical protein, partial [Roseburia sp. AM59-24XD]|uniref:hypothetical protein n=1 Tax=Roseburia sp. AM59-24XD TaxID=2293138 RepID=UPI000FF4C9B2
IFQLLYITKGQKALTKNFLPFIIIEESYLQTFSHSLVLLDSGITTVDESQMFKIVFSPERVICEVPFYE